MRVWTFRALALPLVLVAGLLVAAPPRAADAATSGLAISAVNVQNYGAIARTALAALDQQRGECLPWVRSVIQAATGRTIGADYNTGYLQAGAIEVPLINARDGDIIQITNPTNTQPNADYVGLHTAIVLDNLGGGKFRVVDSNSNYDGIVDRKSTRLNSSH